MPLDDQEPLWGESLMKKMAIVSFEGNMSCFVHALLNVWDYHQKGYEVALIIEGQSCARIADIGDSPKGQLWNDIKTAGLIKAVCKACAAAVDTLDAAEEQELPIDATLSGHAALEPYTTAGYEIVLF